MITILVADDDYKLLNMLRRTLTYEGFRVVTESCTQKVGPSACVRKLTSSRSCAMMDTTDRGGQYGKAVFAQAQVPDCDGGAER